MLELDLKYLRKIKIWFNQNDKLALQENNVERKEFPSFGTSNITNKTVIVELLIPRGGRIIYGLLGADYVLTVSDNLIVNILSGNILRPKFLGNPLLGNADPVKLCLPDELRFAVFEEIKSMYEDASLNIRGKLNFCYGAFSEISSSEWVFRKLTRLVVNLLKVPEGAISSNLLNELIDG